MYLFLSILLLLAGCGLMALPFFGAHKNQGAAPRGHLALGLAGALLAALGAAALWAVLSGRLTLPLR